MVNNDINEVKLMGGKRKNGHKMDCSCHICHNMKNKAKRGGYEEEEEKAEELKKGGSKKKNGHRMNCKCVICKNMSKSKKGGSEEESDSDEEKSESDEEEKKEETGGRKKRGNGHKMNCQCPICKNMRKSKKGGEIVVEEKESNEVEASSNDYENMNGGKKKITFKRRARRIHRKTRKLRRFRKT